jgi:hypothetical protein
MSKPGLLFCARSRALRSAALLFAVAKLASCGSSGGTGENKVLVPASNNPFWTQWGFSANHEGDVPVVGQSLSAQLADILYDPFVAQEQAELYGALVAHYPATLVDGDDFYTEMKTGNYVSCSSGGNWTNGAACGPNTWDQMIWNVARYNWQGGKAVQIWQFQSDWKPEPNGQGLGGWEPVFHPALANDALYVPGAAGTLWKVDKTTGTSMAHIDPFGGAASDPKDTFVAGPLTADANGNIYYNVLQLSDPKVAEPWQGADSVGAWLVKIDATGAATMATYASLVPGAPAASATTCPGQFNAEALPWPPTPTAVPVSQSCGSQRPGVNIAPAIASDGTIYTVSRAHFDSRVGYLVAVNPDLTPKWQGSLQRRLSDGCGALIPIATDTVTPNSCRPGTTVGVDPTTNDLGSGDVSDSSSSSPTALPDGGVLYGAWAQYNAQRGHLFKFDAAGNFAGTYDFGWDSSPAIYPHDGTYSVVIKDNHYDTQLYCYNDDPICQTLPGGPFYITQLDANLKIEWQFQNTTIDSDHPNGFEWCINAPAIDSSGVVYVDSEDGNVYALAQGESGTFTVPSQKHFLKLALEAAYTPLSIGPDGKIYTQNDGHLFAVGNYRLGPGTDARAIGPGLLPLPKREPEE